MSHEPTQALRFDEGSRRWCIGELELHCGDVFLIRPAHEPARLLGWLQVRIEHNSEYGWFLITDLGTVIPSGLLEAKTL
jgi:uncharacterized protein DUF5348